MSCKNDWARRVADQLVDTAFVAPAGVVGANKCPYCHQPMGKRTSCTRCESMVRDVQALLVHPRADEYIQSADKVAVYSGRTLDGQHPAYAICVNTYDEGPEGQVIFLWDGEVGPEVSEGEAIPYDDWDAALEALQEESAQDGVSQHCPDCGQFLSEEGICTDCRGALSYPEEMGAIQCLADELVSLGNGWSSDTRVQTLQAFRLAEQGMGDATAATRALGITTLKQGNGLIETLVARDPAWGSDPRVQALQRYFNLHVGDGGPEIFTVSSLKFVSPREGADADKVFMPALPDEGEEDDGRYGDQVRHFVTTVAYDLLRCGVPWETVQARLGERLGLSRDEVVRYVRMWGRRVYGYAQEGDEFELLPAPEDDGLGGEREPFVREWDLSIFYPTWAIVVTQLPTGEFLCSCGRRNCRHIQTAQESLPLRPTRVSLAAGWEPMPVWLRAWRTQVGEPEDDKEHRVRLALDGSYDCSCETWAAEGRCGHVENVGAGMLGFGGIIPVEEWEVPSESDGEKRYIVKQCADGAYSCACMDWLMRRRSKGEDCKHIAWVKDQQFRPVGDQGLPEPRLGIERFVSEVTVEESDVQDRPSRLIVPLRPFGDTHFLATMVYDMLRRNVSWQTIKDWCDLPSEWTRRDVIEHVRINGRRIYGDRIEGTGRHKVVVVPTPEDDGLEV